MYSMQKKYVSDRRCPEPTKTSDVNPGKNSRLSGTQSSTTKFHQNPMQFRIVVCCARVNLLFLLQVLHVTSIVVHRARVNLLFLLQALHVTQGHLGIFDLFASRSMNTFQPNGDKVKSHW
jgi:hypothetical protein